MLRCTYRRHMDICHRIYVQVLIGMKMRGLKCEDESAKMKVRGWKCKDESARMKVQGWKCGDEKAKDENAKDESVRMKVRGWKCKDEISEDEISKDEKSEDEKAEDENARMKLRGWSVTQPDLHIVVLCTINFKIYFQMSISLDGFKLRSLTNCFSS